MNQSHQPILKESEGFENLPNLDVTVSTIDTNAPPIDEAIPANVANSLPIAPPVTSQYLKLRL